MRRPAALTVRQASAAGVIDQLMLDVAPGLLGTGERLFAGVHDPVSGRSRSSTPRMRHVVR